MISASEALIVIPNGASPDMLAKLKDAALVSTGLRLVTPDDLAERKAAAEDAAMRRQMSAAVDALGQCLTDDQRTVLGAWLERADIEQVSTSTGMSRTRVKQELAGIRRALAVPTNADILAHILGVEAA